MAEDFFYNFAIWKLKHNMYQHNNNVFKLPTHLIVGILYFNPLMKKSFVICYKFSGHNYVRVQ